MVLVPVWTQTNTENNQAKLVPEQEYGLHK